MMGWLKKIDKPPAEPKSTRHDCAPPGSSPYPEVRITNANEIYFTDRKLRAEIDVGSIWQCDDCGQCWKVNNPNVPHWVRTDPPEDKPFTKRQLRKMAKQIGL